jgi:hypothetical protein
VCSTPQRNGKIHAFATLRSQKVNHSFAIVALCRGVRSSGVSRRFWC